MVKGALARFIVRPIQADRTLCLGINEKSPYNPDNHVDILLHEVTAAEAGTPSDRVTKLDGQLYALDRFRTILAPVSIVPPIFLRRKASLTTVTRMHSLARATLTRQ